MANAPNAPYDGNKVTATTTTTTTTTAATATVTATATATATVTLTATTTYVLLTIKTQRGVRRVASADFSQPGSPMC